MTGNLEMDEDIDMDIEYGKLRKDIQFSIVRKMVIIILMVVVIALCVVSIIQIENWSELLFKDWVTIVAMIFYIHVNIFIHL